MVQWAEKRKSYQVLNKLEIPVETIGYIILGRRNGRLFDMFHIGLETFSGARLQKLQRLRRKEELWHSQSRIDRRSNMGGMIKRFHETLARNTLLIVIPLSCSWTDTSR